MPIGWNAISSKGQAQARSVYFTGDLIDLRSFCRGLTTGTLDQPVKDAAAHVLTALEPGSYVVAEDHRGPKVEECGGVAVYFPPPLASVSPYYRDLDFAQRGGTTS